MLECSVYNVSIFVYYCFKKNIAYSHYPYEKIIFFDDSFFLPRIRAYLKEYVRLIYRSTIKSLFFSGFLSFQHLLTPLKRDGEIRKGRSDRISDRISESDIFQISEKSEIG